MPDLPLVMSIDTRNEEIDGHTDPQRASSSSQVGLPVDPTLVRLADLAKAAAGLELRAPASRPKVIIALRRRTRVLTNAAELAAALAAASMEATVAEFGTMTFAEQARCPAAIERVVCTAYLCAAIGLRLPHRNILVKLMHICSARM